jgi:phosphate acetyltransferase
MNAKEQLLGSLLKKAKGLGKKPRMVLCEGWDARGLKAAEFIVKEGIAEMILIGEESKVREAAKQNNVDISWMEIIDHSKSSKKEALAEQLFKLREKKGMTKEQAAELIKDVNYFGCMMAVTGEVDAVLGSLICPTAELMRPSLQLLRKDFVSEIMVIYDPKKDRVVFMTDASMNIDPAAEQLAHMGINAAKAARLFSVEPKVGYLSFSTYGSGGDGPQIAILKEAIRLVKEKEPGLRVDGEFQVDAAVNPEAAKKKCPGSPLGGQVNVLVFPNLSAANVFAHGMMQFSDTEFLFTMMEGMQKPVYILGRSTSQETVTNMFIMAAIEAEE